MSAAGYNSTTAPRKKLQLLNLRRDDCLRLGAPTDVANACQYAVGRALGRAIYSGYKNVDGFLFASRLTGADVYAVFDRAVDKLIAPVTGDLERHPELPHTLSRHGITLIVTVSNSAGPARN